MKKIYAFTVMLFIFFTNSIAQGNVGIGTNSPDNSAKLEISTASDPAADKKGLLIPNVALTATNSAAHVVSPATSLLVYNTATAGTAPNNVSPGYYYWDGTKWVRMVNSVKAQNGANISITGPNASASDPYHRIRRTFSASNNCFCFN